MFIYTYASHEEEADLAQLELRTLFGISPAGELFIDADNEALSPSRSPFLKRRINVAAHSDCLEGNGGLLEQLRTVALEGKTFKVVFSGSDEAFTYGEKRQLERMAGAQVTGTAAMRSPEVMFGLAKLGGRWYFGPCEDNEALWLAHQSKPQNYSTALNTRTARAVVNIAAGRGHAELNGGSQAFRMIDPCCGMGTVLIEALSMGFAIDGFDMNPLAVRGARVNLAHFGYENRIALADMRLLQGSYDAAIMDMPYNLCSVLPEEESLSMLQSLRRLTSRAVIVTTVPVEEQLEKALWTKIDRAIVRKGSFTRYVTVVE